MCRHTPLPSLTPSRPAPSRPSRSSRSPELSSLCSSVASHQLSRLQLVVYIRQCHSLSPSHPLLTPLRPQVPSLHLHLYSHPAIRFIRTIFLDPLYMCVCVSMQYLFFSCWLTSLCVTGSRSIHTNNFQVYDTVSLPVITTLYIRPSFTYRWRFVPFE